MKSFYFSFVLSSLMLSTVSSANIYKPKSKAYPAASLKNQGEDSVLETRYELSSTLTLNSEERDHLRQSFLDTMRERRVTATMSPKSSMDVTTTRSRFSRLRKQSNTKRPPTVTTAKDDLYTTTSRLSLSQLRRAKRSSMSET